MFSKKTRNKDKLSKHPLCWICGNIGEWDHLRSRGAGGGNEPENIQPLCRPHHQERHFIGIQTFKMKYNLPIGFESGYPKRTDIKTSTVENNDE